MILTRCSVTRHTRCVVTVPARPKTEADAYTAPLIQKVGAPSIAQIEKLIGSCKKQKIFSNPSTSEFSEKWFAM
jgi:hypothetical protein